ncbi:MAG TPA: hypothetical protein VK866_16900 [Acidimicrobiales bacterium]|nr:hypothetical protein [Acidimicrobiales bacterium]
MADDRPSALDRVLDLVVYAPIGAAFEGERALSDMARVGRSQVANARFIGRLAVDRGRHDAERVVGGVVDEVRRRTGSTLTAVARAAGAPLAGSGRPDAPTEPPGADRRHLRLVGDDVEAAPEPAPDVAPPADGLVPDVDELPIPGYDSLSASQVVPRLDALSADELEAVGEYERAHRRRMTILNRIAQLRAS